MQFLSNFLFGKICLHLFYFSNAKFVQQMWPFVGKYQILPPFEGIRFGMFLIMCTLNIFGECRRKMAALFYSSLSWEIYWSDLFLLDRFICSIQAWQDTEYQVDISPKLDLAAPQVSNKLACEFLERKGSVMYKGPFLPLLFAWHAHLQNGLYIWLYFLCTSGWQEKNYIFIWRKIESICRAPAANCPFTDFSQ